MFWDLVQRSHLGNPKDETRDMQRRTMTLEKRMALLEDEVRATQDLLIRLVERLEERFGEDLDGDGNVGSVHRPGHPQSSE